MCVATGCQGYSVLLAWLYLGFAAKASPCLYSSPFFGILLCVCSEESAQQGFTIIIDNRHGFWKNLKTLLSVIKVRMKILVVLPK